MRPSARSGGVSILKKKGSMSYGLFDSNDSGLVVLFFFLFECPHKLYIRLCCSSYSSGGWLGSTDLLLYELIVVFSVSRIEGKDLVIQMVLFRFQVTLCHMSNKIIMHF